MKIRAAARRDGSFGLGLLLAGCALSADPPLPSDAVACVAPRPEICTMQYLPVCGWRESGARRTYSNACSACADVEIAAHRPGACDD